MAATVGDAVQDAKDGVLIKVWVVPGASESGPVGVVEGYLRLRVRSRPEKGEANREILDLLAAALGLAPSALEVVRGKASRRKLVLARHIRREMAVRSLEGWLVA